MTPTTTTMRMMRRRWRWRMRTKRGEEGRVFCEKEEDVLWEERRTFFQYPNCAYFRVKLA